MDTTKTTTHLGLCAGYGGIELGLKRVIPNLRSVALCEIEAYACANLVAKMEAGLMEPAPIWTDLKTFPWAEFRDRVDILTGGYPCQPFSAAGKRLGTEDPRHLWPYIASGIRILRPKLCFFENVEGHISLGLREVIGELEQMGYKVSWGIFSAREVGAPHQRKRVFILAYDKSQRIQGHWADWLQEPRPHAGQGLPLRGGDAGCGELANTLCNGSGEGWLIRQGADGAESVSNGESWGAWPSRPGEAQHGWEPPRVVGSVPAKLANFCSRDAQQGGNPAQTSGEGTCERGQGEDAMPHGGSSLCGGDQGDEPPRVVANDHREHAGHGEQRPERTLRDLSGGCGEAMGNAASQRPQEWPQRCNHSPVQATKCGGGSEGDRQAQPAMGRNADGLADRMGYAELCVSCDNRTDELRLLGNGVVPATAERAFRTLLNELNT